MDAEQRAAYIAALHEERRNPHADHDSIDAELARLEAAPAERARKATSTKAAAARRRSA
jgi:hypothetical protein